MHKPDWRDVKINLLEQMNLKLKADNVRMHKAAQQGDSILNAIAVRNDNKRLRDALMQILNGTDDPAVIAGEALEIELEPLDPQTLLAKPHMK